MNREIASCKSSATPSTSSTKTALAVNQDIPSKSIMPKTSVAGDSLIEMEATRDKNLIESTSRFHNDTYDVLLASDRYFHVFTSLSLAIHAIALVLFSIYIEDMALLLANAIGQVIIFSNHVYCPSVPITFENS